MIEPMLYPTDCKVPARVDELVLIPLRTDQIGFAESRSLRKESDNIPRTFMVSKSKDHVLGHLILTCKDIVKLKSLHKHVVELDAESISIDSHKLVAGNFILRKGTWLEVESSGEEYVYFSEADIEFQVKDHAVWARVAMNWLGYTYWVDFSWDITRYIERISDFDIAEYPEEEFKKLRYE